MEDTLEALSEQKAQIESLMHSFSMNFQQARFNGASLSELQALIQQGKALDRELDNINSEIAKIEANAKKIEQAQKLNAIKLREAQQQAEILAAEHELLEKERQKQEMAKKQWADIGARINKKISSYAEKILDTLNVQVMPSTVCVEPNDAFIKSLFRFGPKSFKQALQGRKFSVREKRQTAKKDAIYSHLKVTNADGYEDDKPLTEFDRAVLGILISEYLAGNRYTTVNIIHRALIGKIGKACEGIIPNKNQQDAIVNSVIKFMGTIVDFSGAADSLLEMKYTDKNGNEVILKSANLLSADIIDAKINGQVMDGVIFFKGNSPLFDIADAKNQIIRYPHALLNVPNQNNTPRIISIKKYVLRRICEIKLHHMTPTITFDDVFQKCRLLDSPRKTKMDSRNAIVNLFQHLKDQNFISSFELVQVRNKFVSVKFSYSQQ